MKYYAVKKGRKTGIFETWDACSESVRGYPGAVYKSFPTRSEAIRFLEEAGADPVDGNEPENVTEKKAETGRPDDYVLAETADAYVDGSYLAATGEFSYGCVVLIGDTEIRFCEKMADAELASMHNVAGEIKGAEAAMRFAVANGITELTIYHDYEGIAKWCTGEWTATKEGTIAYRDYYQHLPKDLHVRFKKVRGHSGDTYNELADRLAKLALGIA